MQSARIGYRNQGALRSSRQLGRGVLDWALVSGNASLLRLLLRRESSAVVAREQCSVITAGADKDGSWSPSPSYRSVGYQESSDRTERLGESDTGSPVR